MQETITANDLIKLYPGGVVTGRVTYTRQAVGKAPRVVRVLGWQDAPKRDQVLLIINDLVAVRQVVWGTKVLALHYR